MNPRILVVAIPESIHTVRWLNQLQDTGWNILLFPSYEDGVVRIHDEILNNQAVEVYLPYKSLYFLLKKLGMGSFANFLLSRVYHFNKRINKKYYSRRLSLTIKKYKPNLVHSLETQRAGYLVSDVKESFLSIKFPVWWHTNWGSDIFLFGRIISHERKIRKVLEKCDYYSCECNRDIQLARQYGFKGVTFPVYPNTGGFDPLVIDKLRAEAMITSKRKIIMLKGYQGWAGRALVGIRALERCSAMLKNYKIVIYSNSQGEDVAISAALFSQNAGIEVEVLPGDTDHTTILRYHSQARISIGLSITDAISTSLLEAMAMGSFPIQSCTACASEWFEDGISGLLVTPEDPEVIEIAIRKALEDDNLVNSAAETNYKKILVDANFEKLKQKTISSYKEALHIDHV